MSRIDIFSALLGGPIKLLYVNNVELMLMWKLREVWEARFKGIYLNAEIKSVPTLGTPVERSEP